MRITVRKDNVRAELVGSVLQTEVHEEDTVNGLQVKLPAGSLLTLTRNGMRKIEQRTLLKVRLLPVLHLHDDMLPCLRGAIDVINNTPVTHVFGQQLFIQKSDVLYGPLTHQQVVQEVYEQILADLLAEYLLETHVRKRIDKFSHAALFLAKIIF